MFTHLHTHSFYSLLTASRGPKVLIAEAAKKGYKAMALTDHSSTAGLVEFYKAAKKKDIHPILGVDLNIAKRSRHDKEAEDRKTSQIVLLAENYQGYQNILKLSTEAYLEGFYYRPRIDHELLSQHGEGVIALSGGKRSEISIALQNEEPAKAKEILDQYRKYFGNDNVYISIMRNPDDPDLETINIQLISFANEHNVSLVATHGTYYAASEDKASHDILLCIRDGRTTKDENRFRMPGDLSILPETEIQQRFVDLPEALENTQKIADRCQVELPLGQMLLPSFPVPEGEDEASYLRILCEEGLKKRYDPITPLLQERLDYELKIIHQMGYDAYFLIVWDFIYYSKNNDIMVGPGRGSAAGSIVAYCLEITDIDPIRFDLIFERFLNPARVSMPDIDIDFIDTKRDKIIEYVQEKYGRDKVAQISTYGTMAARAAVRDVARASGYPYGVGDRIAKAIPSTPGIKLQDVLDEEPLLKELYGNPENKEIIDNALKLEGCIRNTSIHAAAVVIGKDPLTLTTALQTSSKGENIITTQYSMKPIEELGLLKMDFLGLKNLSIIERCLDNIKETKGEVIDILHIPLDDPKPYEMLSEGAAIGVFQFESPGMRKYLKELKPTCIEDLIAMVSLYRPGPMEFISDFIDGKHGRKEIIYLHPCLEPILSETYGIAVYQEQIQRIAQDFAGYSLGEADLLRRAIGKKIKAELDAQREVFLRKSAEMGRDKDLAEKLFSFVEPFARYGFNKAHAASYAMISYQTAYLKANYPVEYMTSILTADSGNTEKIIKEIAECEQMGIEVVPPNVNSSCEDFTVSADGKAIYFGLAAIKNIGEGPAQAIMEVRGDTPFESISDFIKRLGSKFTTKKVLESLAKTGALDDLAERNQVLENIGTITAFVKGYEKTKHDSQIDLFAALGSDAPQELVLPEMIPATPDERLMWEKELIGVYVSSHPLEDISDYLKKYTTPIDELLEAPDDTKAKVGGIVTQSRVIYTKKGDPMMFLTIEDRSGSSEGVVFPRAYHDVIDVIAEGRVIVAEAKVNTRERHGEPERSLIINRCKEVDMDKARAFKLTAKDKTKVLAKKVKMKQAANGKSPITPAKSGPAKRFSVVVPQDLDISKLEQIHSLLKSHPGQAQGRLHLTISDEQTSILDIPFGVAWDDVLAGKIQALLV